MGKFNDEDVMLVVIVTENGQNSGQVEMSRPDALNTEKQNANHYSTGEISVEDVINEATKHGEFVVLDSNKNEIHYEYLDEAEGSVTGKRNKKNLKQIEKPKKSVIGSKLAVSYVETLKKQNPELRNNEDLLVKRLVQEMKRVGPTLPPVHHKVQNEDGLFSCVLCGYLTKSEAASNRHYSIKHGPRYLICFACGVNFRSTTNMYKHEKRCSAPDAVLVLKARGQFLGRKGKGRPFMTNNKFTHRKRATEDGKLRCRYCSARFTQLTGLRAHVRAHAARRPHACAACPARYTSRTGLKRHLSVHTGQQYMCDYCGKSFRLKSTLKTHINLHLPVGKYRCDICARSFNQKEGLVHHVNKDHLHLPPPCACPACPKRYSRTAHLQQHMKTKHGLSLMTRKMFLKALPYMAQIELKNAMVVFANEGNK